MSIKNILDIKKWKEFKLQDLFNISKTKDSSKIKENGNIPYVSRKSINNGVIGYKKVPWNLIERNCLTIHSEWSSNFICIYQNDYFCADGKLVKLENKNLNKFNGMFISTVISKTPTSNYRLETIKKTIIKLPINKKREPDWIYMENYIKNLYFFVSDIFSKISKISN